MRKIASGQGNDYTTVCLLDYPNFKENYKMIAIDLVNNKLLISILEEFNKLISLQIQIEQEIQKCFSLLKKQKKLFWTFLKEL